MRRYALQVLGQQKSLLQHIDANTYATPCTLLGASVGQHVRHSLDHFSRCIFAEPDVTIMYDERSRGTDVETDPQAALQVVKHCMEAISDLHEDVDVTVEFMTNGDGNSERFRSCLSRELAFAAHHAIHHNAMIKVITKIPSNGKSLFQNVCMYVLKTKTVTFATVCNSENKTDFNLMLPDDFGTAPSTIAFESETLRLS